MPHPPHVLLVDDHAEVRAILSHVLTQRYPTITIAEASHGGEALAAVAQQPPNLVITDYQMPVMGGLELVRALRRQGMTMPIVAISSDSGVAGTMLAAGADHFLRKPVHLAALVQVLRTLLPESGHMHVSGE